MKDLVSRQLVKYLEGRAGGGRLRLPARPGARRRLEAAFVIDVSMQNVPTPTAGRWNIMDIYSPGKNVHHVATGAAAEPEDMSGVESE